MNFKKLLASIAKVAVPIIKTAAPVVIGAILTHQSAKAAAADVIQAELAKRGA